MNMATRQEEGMAAAQAGPELLAPVGLVDRGDGGVRLQDLLPPFDGKSDATAWWRIVERALDIIPLRRPEAIIPMFFRGAALEVYERLTREQRGSLVTVERAIKKAFAPSPFIAMAEFQARAWQPGETVDCLLRDIRRLAKMVNDTMDDESIIIRTKFVVALPADVRRQMEATPGLAELSVDAIVTIARALMIHQCGPVGAVSSAGQCDQGGCGVGAVARNLAKRKSSKPRMDKAPPGVKCWCCGGNHFRRNCPDWDGESDDDSPGPARGSRNWGGGGRGSSWATTHAKSGNEGGPLALPLPAGGQERPAPH